MTEKDNTEPAPKALPERFWNKVQAEPNSGCWIWTAFVDKAGYGFFRYNGKMRRPHRISYEFHVGPVPIGLELDHLCRIRNCVNPDHLEAVTHLENVRRGDAGLRMALKTHCPQGHPYSGKNLSVSKKGHRQCMECNRAKAIRYYYRNKHLTPRQPVKGI